VNWAGHVRVDGYGVSVTVATTGQGRAGVPTREPAALTLRQRAGALFPLKSEALAHESVVDQGLLGLAQARYVAFHRAAAG
jgi:hypothetical protein